MLALCPLSSANAVSLYDGLKTRSATTGPIVPILPGAVLANLPGTLSTIPNLIGIDASIPQIPDLTVTPLAPEIAITPITAVTPAADQPTAISGLQATGDILSSPTPAAPAAAASALDQLFIGGANTSQASIAEHVGAAVGEYFGALAPGQEPGVVVAKKKHGGIEAAPTDDEMLNNVKSSSRSNPEREQIAIKLFEKGGAAYDAAASAVKTPDFSRDGQVQVQEVPGWDGGVSHNIFVVKKGHPKAGQPERVIVITSHNDKVDVGDGVIDNWTGTTMVAHLYASIKDVGTEATYIFATFAREEEGLIGSKTWVRSLSSAQRAQIEGNVNYDTIAIKGGETNSWENNSDEVLLDAIDKAVAAANAKRGPNDQLSLKRAHLDGGDADSSTFRNQRPPIPGMTIYSGPEDLVFSIIHSVNDNIGAFDFALYKNTYLVALALIAWLDAHPLSAAPAAGVS